MKGLKGGQNKTYGGEVDILPTLMHLLGVSTKKYVQFGTDLLSRQHSQVVAQRNGNFITPKYSVISETPYVNTGTDAGREATNLAPADKKALAADEKKVNKELRLSDTLANKNLLRFYTPAGFTPVDGDATDYDTSLQRMLAIERSLSATSTSQYSQDGSTNAAANYQSDSPELAKNRSVLTQYPKKVIKQANTTETPMESMISSAKRSSVAK